MSAAYEITDRTALGALDPGISGRRRVIREVTKGMIRGSGAR
jgi:hypothetical protein